MTAFRCQYGHLVHPLHVKLLEMALCRDMRLLCVHGLAVFGLLWPGNNSVVQQFMLLLVAAQLTAPARMI